MHRRELDEPDEQRRLDDDDPDELDEPQRLEPEPLELPEVPQLLPVIEII